jgi:hypothetical protein
MARTVVVEPSVVVILRNDVQLVRAYWNADLSVTGSRLGVCSTGD